MDCFEFTINAQIFKAISYRNNELYNISPYPKGVEESEIANAIKTQTSFKVVGISKDVIRIKKV